MVVDQEHEDPEATVQEEATATVENFDGEARQDFPIEGTDAKAPANEVESPQPAGVNVLDIINLQVKESSSCANLSQQSRSAKVDMKLIKTKADVKKLEDCSQCKLESCQCHSHANMVLRAAAEIKVKDCKVDEEAEENILLQENDQIEEAPAMKEKDREQ